jgi:hypothetical protein
MSKADMSQVGGSHYKDLKITPWDALESWLSPEEFRGFLKGNAVKYLARAGKKRDALEDIRKARHYLEKLEEMMTPPSDSSWTEPEIEGSTGSDWIKAAIPPDF